MPCKGQRGTNVQNKRTSNPPLQGGLQKMLKCEREKTKNKKLGREHGNDPVTFNRGNIWENQILQALKRLHRVLVSYLLSAGLVRYLRILGTFRKICSCSVQSLSLDSQQAGWENETGVRSMQREHPDLSKKGAKDKGVGCAQ